MTIFERLAGVLRRFPFLIIIPYRVHKYFQAKFTLGVVGVVLNKEQQVLLVEHVFHPVVPWGLPGGWVDQDEDPALAIKREVYEELGIIVDEVTLLSLEKNKLRHLDIAYVCHVTKDEVVKLSFELTDYGWFDLNELPRLHKFHWLALQKVRQQLQSNEEYGI